MGLAKTRGEALAAKDQKFFTGLACKYGHISERRVSNSACCQCEFNKGKNRRKNNPGAASESCKRWYQNNKEREAVRKKIDRENNPEKFARRMRSWLDRNPEKFSVILRRRRARKRNAIPPWFGELDELVMLEAADLVRRREVETGIKWHVDHSIPLQSRKACGLHVGANVQVIPASVNLAKNNRMIFTEPLEWLAAL